MEILVTGPSGVLGPHLVAALLRRGHRVRALLLPTEDASWLSEMGAVTYVGDVREPGSLAEPMRGANAVFHLASKSSGWRPMGEYHEVNVAGTANVCAAALAAGVRRFIHVSAAVVYGLGHRRPVGEDRPLAPIDDPYCVTKAASDELVQGMIARRGLPGTIVRPGTIIGPGDQLNFGRIAERLLKGKGIVIGSGRNALLFTYVTDVVQGLLLALDCDRAVGQAYNIGTDQPLTQSRALGAIAREVGAAPPRVHIPYALAYTLAFAAERLAVLSGYRHQPIVTRHGVALYGSDNRLSIAKARSELGYEPKVPVAEGIRIAGAWWRETASRFAGQSQIDSQRAALAFQEGSQCAGSQQ